MDAKPALLVSLLATQDAIFRPMREWGSSGTIYAARARFFRFGTAWHSRAATTTDRKASQRALESLVADGLVGVRRHGKQLFVKLSPQADDRARRLAGLPGIDAGHAFTAEVARLSTVPAVYLTDLWIRETALSHEGQGWGDGHSRELVIVEDLAAPAIVRGWVDSRTTVRGHAFYAVTEAGREAIASGEPLPADAEEVPQLRTLYVQRLAAELGRLAVADDPTDSRSLEIPLPVAVEGLPIGPYARAAS